MRLQEGLAPAMARQQLLSQLLADAWQLQDHLVETCPIHLDAFAAQASPCPPRAAMRGDSTPQNPSPCEHGGPGAMSSGIMTQIDGAIHDSDDAASATSRHDLHRNPATSCNTLPEPNDTVLGAPDHAGGGPCLQQHAELGTSEEPGRAELLVLAWSVMPPGLEAQAFRLLDLASEPRHAAAAVEAAESSLKAARASSARPCMMASARLGFGGRQGPGQVQPSSGRLPSECLTSTILL